MSTANVRDSAAEPGKFRIHEIVTKMEGRQVLETKKYSLGCDQAVEMPLEHAMQFLKDKTFVVTDKEGNRIEPVPVQKDGGTGHLVLKPNEVIADLGELTTSALFKRCKVHAHAAGITEKSTRDEMIGFLTKAATPAETVTKDAIAEAGGEAVSPAEMKKLFGED